MDFATDGDTRPGSYDGKSMACKYSEEGTCKYREEHVWSQCHGNQFSKNKGKKCNDNGKLILCTVEEFTHSMEEYGNDDLSIGGMIDNDNDNLSNMFTF